MRLMKLLERCANKNPDEDIHIYVGNVHFWYYPDKKTWMMANPHGFDSKEITGDELRKTLKGMEDCKFVLKYNNSLSKGDKNGQQRL